MPFFGSLNSLTALGIFMVEERANKLLFFIYYVGILFSLSEVFDDFVLSTSDNVNVFYWVSLFDYFLPPNATCLFNCIIKLRE